MKTEAWQFHELGGPESLELVSHELNEPQAGQARIRIEAIGLNRADLLYLAGRYITQPPSPSFLGQEAVGVIEALGPIGDDEATWHGEFNVGQRVGLLVGRVDYAGMGTFRRHGIYPQAALVPWPDALTSDEAAGLWVAGLTSAGGLGAAGLRLDTAAGKNVAVTAASSGVGIAALQIARAWGARTLAITTSSSKVEALSAHADEVIHAHPDGDLAADLLTATGDHGVDVAFDPVGYANLPALFQAAAVDGHVVCYGIMAGTEAPFDLVSLLRKDLAVHGFTVYRLLRNAAKLQAAAATVQSLATTGALRPVVAATYSFADAPAALAAMATNQHLGKIVVTID